VRVRLSEDGDQVCIRVDGDGPGLNYDISAVLMRDFFRVPGLTAPEDGNLAFASNFLAEFGGELRIEERPDQSRWFDLFLPVGTAASR
jgi:C4-dicarboxylate-specific signal transduction histidine kinase